MSDLQAATDRLRRINSGESYADVYGEPGQRLSPSSLNQYDCDQYTVDNAWLAEHDDTPIDEEWLRSVGFEGNIGEVRLAIESGMDLDSDDEMKSARMHHLRTLPGQPWSFDGWEGRFRTHIKCNPKTRGQLRRLAAALGIALQESKP